MSISNPNHQWNNLVENGLLPTVKDLNDYEDKVKNSSRNALDFLRFNPVIVPSPSDWINAHKIMFHSVSDHAGKVRPPGDVVSFGGLLGSDPQRIMAELELLQLQTHTLFEKVRQTQSVQEAMSIVAFCHARFERIHPFSDGNGRVGRMIMDSQIEALFGMQPRPKIDRTEYMSALKSIQADNDLATLTKLLMEREGLAFQPGIIPAPYRMAPLFEDGKTYTLEEDFQRSLPKAPEIPDPQKPKGFKFF